MNIYICKKCGCEMCERPTKQYGRCPNPSCGHKLYPDGYEIAIINAKELQGKIYPAPAWEGD